jgi:hypothetical protein
MPIYEPTVDDVRDVERLVAAHATAQQIGDHSANPNLTVAARFDTPEGAHIIVRNANWGCFKVFLDGDGRATRMERLDKAASKRLAEQLDWKFKGFQRKAVAERLASGATAPDSVVKALADVVELTLVHKARDPNGTRFVYNGRRAGVLELVLRADRTVVSATLLDGAEAIRRYREVTAGR